MNASNTNPFLVLCCLTLLLVSCKSTDIKMRDNMEGDWKILSAIYKPISSNISIRDTSLVYQNAVIHFENCRKGGCNGWYNFPNAERVFFFYYNEASDNTFFLNLGGKGDEHIESLRPSVSLNGTWRIDWKDEKSIILFGKAAFKDKNGSVNVLGTHEATLFLTR